MLKLSMISDILSPYGKVLHLLYIIGEPMYPQEIAESFSMKMSHNTVANKLQEMKKKHYVSTKTLGHMTLYSLNNSGKQYVRNMEKDFHKSINFNKIKKRFKEYTIRNK